MNFLGNEWWCGTVGVILLWEIVSFLHIELIYEIFSKTI